MVGTPLGPALISQPRRHLSNLAEDEGLAYTRYGNSIELVRLSKIGGIRDICPIGDV